jgi:tRNA pseudouridine38-40 synthase
MPNIKLTIEYNGSKFHGWQLQPKLRTIQGELHRAIEMIVREKISYLTAAGRTDAGVHARGQVVNFHLEKEPDLRRLLVAVSSVFRGEISVIEAVVVPDSFDARHSATMKQYRYRILHRPAPPTLEYGQCWHIGGPLDLQLMAEEARSLVGKHDFSSMQGTGCVARSPVKDLVVSELIIQPPFIEYRVMGRSFLKQMVRNIVGTLVARGRGIPKLPPMQEILAALDRRSAGPTAPAHGLTLEWVRYDGVRYGEEEVEVSNAHSLSDTHHTGHDGPESGTEDP